MNLKKLWYPKSLAYAIITWAIFLFVSTFWLITPFGLDQSVLMDGKGPPDASETWGCFSLKRSWACTASEAIWQYAALVPLGLMTLILLPGEITFYNPYLSIPILYIVFALIEHFVTGKRKMISHDSGKSTAKPQTPNPKF
jgi:hypothetical protein